MSYYWSNSKRFQEKNQEVIPEELYADYYDDPQSNKRKRPAFGSSSSESAGYHTGRTALPNVDRMIAASKAQQEYEGQADEQALRVKRAKGVKTKDVRGGVTALAARFGFGDEYSATKLSAQDREQEEKNDGNFVLPKGRPTQDFDSRGTEAASVDKPLTASTSLGFKLLQKMGWKKDTGLGKNAQGIVIPVTMANNTHSKMGLGKAEEAESTGAKATAQRRLQESERQFFATPEEAKAMAEKAERQAVIKEDVQQSIQKFYCEACKKKYTTLHDWHSHIESTAHHHRVRMIETRRRDFSRTANETDEAEASGKEDKALAKMRKAALKIEAERNKLAKTKNAGKDPPKKISMSLGTNAKPIGFGFSMSKSKKSAVKFSFSGKKKKK